MGRILFGVTGSLLLFLPSAFSQTTSTSILGTVTDPTGAVVVGAKVSVVQVRTSQKREDVTSGTGDYNFPLLDVGQYDVTVEAPGFKSETRKNIVIQVNQKARVDFTLQVGTQAEHVDVTSEAVLLHTDEASLGQVVEQRRVVELPLNGRNLGGLAVLQPGVQFGTRMGFDGISGCGGGVPIPGDAISISANGQRDTNQHATLDGVVATEARVNTVPYTPSVEAVEEFKVQAGSYSAEYGTNSGAQLTIVLKSGTNDFHGTAFDFIRNDKLDAEDYFNNYFTAPGDPLNPKNQLRQNQYGGVFSGPFLIPKLYNGKDRTFFMFDYEARKRRQPGQLGLSTVPPDAFRNGDLSALLNRRDDSGKPLAPVQITDPLNGQPFANNIIPASRISAPAKGLIPYWPAAQRTLLDPLSGEPNYFGSGNTTVNDDQRFIRIDHQLTQKDKLFGHYVFEDISYGSINGGNPNFNYFVAGRNQNVATQWIHIFNPTLINEARFGYNRSVDNTFNPRSNTNFNLDSLGLTGLRVLNDGNRPFTSREAGVPPITFENFSSLGDTDGGNGFDFNNQFQISDNVTISRGSHNFKTGIDFRRVMLFRAAANVPRGELDFGSDIASNDFASFLLGFPDTTQTPEGFPQTEVRQNRWGGYFLDDWKATRKLTLNLGLRYEYNSVATDIRGLWRSLDLAHPQNGLPVLVPNIYTPYHFYDPEKKLFMPRLGVAYRLGEKTVIRSGFGIYYNVHQLNNYTILNLNPPLSGSSQFSQTENAAGVLPPNPYTSAQPFGPLSTTSAINANTLNPNDAEPRTIQWSFDIQRQLPSRMALTVGYVGSKGVHIDNTVEFNNPDPALSSLPTTPQQRRPYQFVIDGPGGPVRPISRIRFLDSAANSWYHGLQVDWEKRFSHGLQFNVAYTWSKAEGEGYGRNEGAGYLAANKYQNPRNRANDKGLYGFDVRHNAVINYIYEIPTLAAFKHGPGQSLFGGWQMNGIWTLRTGFPFTVSQNNTLNTVNSPARPDRLQNGSASSPNIRHWFDTNAFQVVTCRADYLANRCHYGNASPTPLEGPAFHNMDFSLFKNFPIHESMKLQFRAEFFNVFNSPNFAPPSGSLNAGTAFLPKSDPKTGQLGADPTQAGRVGGPDFITSLLSPMRVIQFGLKFMF